MDEQLETAALNYHRFPTPGKISVVPTKAMTNQRDLSLAYSPGVAAACTAIAADPGLARSLTARGNLVAVITNGSAVLGLGNIGALAGKPVMEGKGCLFKKFAGIDVFDIELDESDPDKLVDIIAAMEPTFGGINLEDIQAPQCFYIEQKLRERMKIPVFHDDQHGTAIIVGAATLNALEVVGKKIEDIKLVCSGGGAAAIACLDLLVGLGVKRENITVTDSKGVIYAGRNESMSPEKERYAQTTQARTLGNIMRGVDIFLGLSTANVLTTDMVAQMAERPVIMALANPDPEIRPEEAIRVRPDAIIATGRSDYPNQVNNVLCFPFIFRGALDVGATTINEEMKLAAVRAIAQLARMEQTDVTASAYGQTEDTFGPDFLIPRPFDPRLITMVAPAVAEAAMKTGVATRPIEDLHLYRRNLEHFVYRSGNVMQPIFVAARANSRRVIFAEGEDSRVLRAAQIVVDENLARPLLIGRADVVLKQIRQCGLRLQAGHDVDLIDFTSTAGSANNGAPTMLAASMVRSGEADGLICGTSGTYRDHLTQIERGLGFRNGSSVFAAMNLLMLPQHTIFICDTYVNLDPTAAELTEITELAVEELRRFGIDPRVALLSHSQLGSEDNAPARKLREALKLIRQRMPDLEVEGELHGDAALSNQILNRVAPGSRLSGDANLLIMPNLDAANITFNILKVVSGGGVTVGPILLGVDKPAHIVTPTSTVRGLVNMTALTAVQTARQSGLNG